MNKMNDSDLENVSGGLIFNASNISGSDPSRPWEVLDNKNGNVLQRFTSQADAETWVRTTYGAGALNTAQVDWNYVQALRSNPIA